MTFKTEYLTPYELAAQEDRCAPRKRVRIPATLRGSASKGFTVVVTDISVAGFSCEAVSGLHPQDICWLTLPGLAGLQAEIIWNTGAMIGCAFSNLMNAAVLDSVIARS
jgi:hypothetical protein